MIVKFLKPATTFKGVGYSFAKMLLDKGELMLVKNFHALDGLSNPRAEDYVNYLEAVTKQSKRIVYPQLHVTISTSGRDHTKHELTGIAEKWLEGMGYGNQPYMIIFHKDTKNNHVHLVSTRIGRDGKKIKDSYERLKGYEVIDRVMGVVKADEIGQHIERALAYQFATRAQFMMLLEVRGYTLNLKDEAYQVIKYGKAQATIPLADVDQRIGSYQPNKKRLQQLRAITGKYRTEHSPELYPERASLPGGREGKVTGYTSDLADYLHQQFGVQVFFHAKDGKPPYGYTVIDHTQKAVYKGGLLVPLAEFIAPVPEAGRNINTEKQIPEPAASFIPEPDWPDTNVYESTITDTSLYNGAEFTEMPNTYVDFVPMLRLDIADDIDDEAILGMKRRRKGMARTNRR